LYPWRIQTLDYIGARVELVDNNKQDEIMLRELRELRVNIYTT